MPTAAALLRDILRKKKKRKYRKAKMKRPGSADVQDVAVISVYAPRGTILHYV